MRIYYLSPDVDEPIGGIRKLYRHVDILNQHGFDAHVLHVLEGFRCTWFEHDTRVTSLSRVLAAGWRASDRLVVPEIHGPELARIAPGVKKVIFNQNAYNTFLHYPLDRPAGPAAYLHPDVVATLVVSEDNFQYLRYVFPHIALHRIHNGLDPALFSFRATKKRQLAFMPAKNVEEARQVVNILGARGALEGYTLASITRRSEAEAAGLLQESEVFLSFGTREGFGLPPAEAMACGCIVVGYHGQGGKEYFRPEFSYPVPMGEVITFAQTVQGVLETLRADPLPMRARAEAASRYVLDRYSFERESRDVIGFWSGLTRSA